jgi:hypothetical protein
MNMANIVLNLIIAITFGELYERDGFVGIGFTSPIKWEELPPEHQDAIYAESFRILCVKGFKPVQDSGHLNQGRIRFVKNNATF